MGSALEDRTRPLRRPPRLSPEHADALSRRLLLHGKERLALENTLALAEELGMLDAPAEQIVDSTPMLGAPATQDTVKLVRSGVRKLIDAVTAADEQLAQRLDDGLEFDYARPADKPDCRWRERSERERMLTGSQRTQSAPCAPSSRATGCSPTSASRRPTASCASSSARTYGTGPVRSELREREVELAPVPEAPVRPGRLSKHDFAVDLDAGTVTCPRGQAAPIRTAVSGKRRASFSTAVCHRCPLRLRCLPSSGRRQIEIAPEEELLIAARQALDDPAAAEHLRRTRPRIERLLGMLAHRYRARRTRYIGAAKSRLQGLWTAALVNLNAIGRRLAAQAG